jgi:hypothetical protein
LIWINGLYRRNFNGPGSISHYGDVGTGDSDLTWAAQGILAYRFKKFDAYGGYRHMEWDSLNNSVIEDLELSGPIFGARFKF